MILNKIKGVHLDGHKSMSISTPIQEFLAPKQVYLPLVIGNLIYKKK